MSSGTILNDAIMVKCCGDHLDRIKNVLKNLRPPMNNPCCHLNELYISIRYFLCSSFHAISCAYNLVFNTYMLSKTFSRRHFEVCFS